MVEAGGIGGRHVDETENPQDENLEVDVPEGHDNGDRRMSHGGERSDRSVVGN
jgi:hypothetical protein